MSALFLARADDPFCKIAGSFVRQNFPDAVFALGKRGMPLPQVCETWEGDWLISYLSPWIVPEWLLTRAGKAAINFHPGPPEYPGIGCTNFALYHREPVFGVTAHHMDAKVDTGPIIWVRRFPVFETDTVFSLTQRSYAHLLVLFLKLMSDLLLGRELPVFNEGWKRKPYKRIELNALCEITAEMTNEEIENRIRATSFPNMPGAYIVVGRYRFILEPPGTDRASAIQKPE